MDIAYRIVPPNSPDLRALIAKLDLDLAGRYPAEEIHGVDFEDPLVERITFVVAYAGQTAVACGALRPIDGESTELKRFFVEKEFRNRGIASQLLAFLEAEAASAGYATIKLEAGPAQPEAIGLYTKFGYCPIDCFGEYIGYELSLCYEKQL